MSQPLPAVQRHNTLRKRWAVPRMADNCTLPINSGTPTTPDKTVETFQYNFQFRAMVPSCPKETNSPPFPLLVQCCFGLAAEACISCVAANNIAIGEGENNLLICDSKQGECKK